MKKIRYSIIALYVAFTIHPTGIAISQQDYAQFGLPNGAIVRLGKGIPTAPFNIAFSPDGNILAMPSMIGIWFYDTHTYKETALIPCQSWTVKVVSFSPDGKLLASNGPGDAVILWSVSQRQKVASFNGHVNGTTAVSFSADGKTLATGGGDCTIKLWSVPDGNEIARFGIIPGHTSGISCVSLSPDGEYLASGSYDQTVRLWSIAGRQEIITPKTHSDSVNYVFFSPDSKMLISSGGLVKLWSVPDGHEIKTLEGTCASISPDGSMLATIAKANEPVLEGPVIKLFSIPDGQEIASVNKHKHWLSYLECEGQRDWYEFISFSPDGKTLASIDMSGIVKLWSVPECREIATIEGHTNSGKYVFFSPNGEILASAGCGWCKRGDIKLWSTSKLRQISSLKESSPYALHTTCISFSPDGKILASGNFDQTIKLWSIPDGQKIDTLEGHTRDVWSIAFSPDGEMLASGGGTEDGMLVSDESDEFMLIKLWSVKERKVIAKPRIGHPGGIRSLVFSPDGKFLASSGGKLVRLSLNPQKWWAFRTISLKGHTDDVSSVAFSPDGKILATGSFDHTIKLWSVPDGKNITTLAGHTGTIWVVSFSPDGKLLASAGDDKTVRIWSAADYRNIATLKGHFDIICSISFSPDGRMLASASEDSTILLWDLSKFR